MGNRNENRVIGGLVGVNAGKIQESYSMVAISEGKSLTGGFVGSNKGDILSSFSCKINQKLMGGFVGKEAGKTVASGFIHNLPKDKVDSFVDAPLGILKDELELSSDVMEISKGESSFVRFIDKKWRYSIDEKSILNRKRVCIRSVEDMVDFRDRINQGDTEIQNAYVTLEQDLDLGGMEWIAIGTSYGATFQGIFDGNGHSIKNLKCSKPMQFQGLFGVLRGEVYNLTVDMKLSKGQTIGGLAAQNEGIVGCCAAIISIHGNKQSKYVGSLVGRNQGDIFQCYGAGKMSFAVISPIWAACAGVVLVGGLAVGAMVLMQPKKEPAVFNPIPVDTRQEKTDDENDNNTASGFDDTVSYRVNSTIRLSLSSKECVIDLENPTKCNKNMTARIVMENADGTEFTVAETSAIEPGHKIHAVKIEDYAVEKLVLGSYNAVVYMDFYNDDNSLNMINSSAEVKLEVNE